VETGILNLLIDYAFDNYHPSRMIRGIILGTAFSRGYMYLEFTHQYVSSLMPVKFVNHALNKFLTVLHFIGLILYEKLCFDIL
jgi:hypothetical protein